MKRLALFGLPIITMIFLSFALAQQPADSPLLTRDSWSKGGVGFAWNALGDKDFAGKTIDESSVVQYSSMLPEQLLQLVKKYKLKITTREYTPYAPSDGYIAATNKNRGTAKLVEIGDSAKDVGLSGYAAGLPFPNPKNGDELAWDFFHAYHGDDGESEFGVYWISAAGGVERHEVWRWTYINNTMHRTDIEPIPRLSKLADRNLAAASLTETLFPLDRKGQMALFNLFDNPTDREGWIYVPAQKRTMRFTTENHGEAWNNTDLLYEDIRGYSGRPEWMRWKIVEKTTMLAPMCAEAPAGKDAAEKMYNFAEWPHWNPNLKWQPRPVYVVELTPKLASYPYSRQVLYIDAEAFYAHMKVAYDKKGQLWKIMINATNASPDESKKPLEIATSFLVDVQSDHATVFPWYKSRSDIGVDPDMFSLSTLRKKEQ